MGDRIRQPDGTIPLVASYDEHACIRCSMLRPDPAHRPRLIEIRDNLADRITEAETEGWLGEIEGLTINLAAANQKLDQLDATQRQRTILLGMPTVSHTAGRAAFARIASSDTTDSRRA